MGPQGIAGPVGPSGSGTPGTIYGQTTFWNPSTGQWTPTFAIATNPGTGATGTARIAIGSAVLNNTGYPLRMFTNNGGIRIDQIAAGAGIANRLQTLQAQFDYGLNGVSADPVFNNSMYFTMFQAFPIKFATGFAVGGGDRLIIQANGQVTVGATQATNPVANLVVKTKDIEVEDAGRGLILASPDGTRYRITVADGGAITSTAV
jgi:hypothetical protein